MGKPFFYRIEAGALIDFATDDEGQGITLLRFAKELQKGQSDIPFIQGIIDEAHNFINLRSEAGKKGMANRWHNKVITPLNTVITNYNTDITNDNLPVTSSSNRNNIKEKKEIYKERKEKFTPPQPAEVAEYMKEIGYTTGDGERFVDYYEARGWQINGHPMKNWKAAVRTWFRKWKEANEHISTTNTLGIF